MTVRAVVFDVGETLVDETEAWGDWADWLGVPRLTFFAALGGVIARGGDHREVFPLVRPGIDLQAEFAARAAAGRRGAVTSGDLYPDALDCLRALAADGYVIGIAGNQPSATEEVLHALDVPLALVAASESWAVHKPDPAFFRRIASELDLAPAEIAYVGDRLDNDVRPAATAGMVAIFIRRGPWAYLQAGTAEPPEAAATIESLGELPGLLRRLATGGAATADPT
ncbi:MAG TPA: HAD family hydrolase [Candidatus Limnocylindrales bacterium]|nr:HAD family hydrolase [Candidatus Limnocylindrales bacterium]